MHDTLYMIHSMWNPFKKISSNDPNQLGFIQRIAMKKLEKMSSKEKEKMMQEAMRPENIAKNKDKILAAMEQMKASGQITEEQIKIAKNKFGL